MMKRYSKVRRVRPGQCGLVSVVAIHSLQSCNECASPRTACLSMSLVAELMLWSKVRTAG
jgi:hypothetical protein